MSDIRFQCPNCTKGLVVDERGVGQTVECPGCGKSLVIPEPQSRPTCSKCHTSFAIAGFKPGEKLECPGCGQSMSIRLKSKPASQASSDQTASEQSELPPSPPLSPITCPSCGVISFPNASFCSKCGKDLVSGERNWPIALLVKAVGVKGAVVIGSMVLVAAVWLIWPGRGNEQVTVAGSNHPAPTTSSHIAQKQAAQEDAQQLRKIDAIKAKQFEELTGPFITTLTKVQVGFDGGIKYPEFRSLLTDVRVAYQTIKDHENSYLVDRSLNTKMAFIVAIYDNISTVWQMKIDEPSLTARGLSTSRDADSEAFKALCGLYPALEATIHESPSGRFWTFEEVLPIMMTHASKWTIELKHEIQSTRDALAHPSEVN
jgi:ribosomal protein S27AE